MGRCEQRIKVSHYKSGGLIVLRDSQNVAFSGIVLQGEGYVVPSAHAMCDVVHGRTSWTPTAIVLGCSTRPRGQLPHSEEDGTAPT